MASPTDFGAPSALDRLLASSAAPSSRSTSTVASTSIAYTDEEFAKNCHPAVQALFKEASIELSKLPFLPYREEDGGVHQYPDFISSKEMTSPIMAFAWPSKKGVAFHLRGRVDTVAEGIEGVMVLFIRAIPRGIAIISLEKEPRAPSAKPIESQVTQKSTEPTDFPWIIALGTGLNSSLPVVYRKYNSDLVRPVSSSTGTSSGAFLNKKTDVLGPILQGKDPLFELVKQKSSDAE